MAIEILMPALSPTMEEGKLAKWLVKEGDEVQSGDVIAEIETDKAIMEFEAVDEGRVGKIIVAEGTEGVKVNDAIAVLLADGEDASAITASASQASPEAEAPAQAQIPATSPAQAPAPAQAPSQVTPVASAPAPSAQNGQRIFATPLAKRIAAEKNLDLSQIQGSGPHGRIVKADVENATAPSTAPASTTAQTATTAPAQAVASAPSPAASALNVAKIYEGRKYEEISLDGMRKTIAARLTEAKQTIPHFYLRRDIMLDPLLSFRAELNSALQAREIKLSVNDFIIKACAAALQQIPQANAVWAGDRILQMDASDISVAVAIDGGLLTPVIQDADKKSLSALSSEMKDLAKRARDRKLAAHEFQGGSFSISNLGMFGVDNFDAVINPPQGAILAVGAGAKKPIIDGEGQVSVATVMSVTLSVDHRVIDGALGAQLLEAIVNNIENPMTLLA